MEIFEATSKTIKRNVMCTKRRFATRAGALLRIAEIKTKGEVREKNPCREYYCGECGGYHLTSQKMSDKKKQLIAKRKKFKPEKIANEWIKKKGW
jgi:hypothetical protein